MSLPQAAGFITSAASKGIAVGMAGVGAAAGIIPLLFGAFIMFVPEEHVFVRTVGKRRWFKTVEEVSFDLREVVTYVEEQAVEYCAYGGVRRFTRVKEIIRYERVNVVRTKHKVLRRNRRNIVMRVPGILPGQLIDMREATTPFRDPDPQAFNTGKSEGTDGNGVQHVLDLQLAWRFDGTDDGIGKAHFTTNDPGRLVVAYLWPKLLGALQAYKGDGPVPFQEIFATVVGENQGGIQEKFGIIILRLSQQANAVTAAQVERMARTEAATILANAQVEAARVAADITAKAHLEAARIAAKAQNDAATTIANGSLYQVDGHLQGDKAKGAVNLLQQQEH